MDGRTAGGNDDVSLPSGQWGLEEGQKRNKYPQANQQGDPRQRQNGQMKLQVNRAVGLVVYRRRTERRAGTLGEGRKPRILCRVFGVVQPFHGT